MTSQESSACRVSAHSVDGIAKVTAVNAVNERSVVKTGAANPVAKWLRRVNAVRCKRSDIALNERPMAYRV